MGFFNSRDWKHENHFAQYGVSGYTLYDLHNRGYLSRLVTPHGYYYDNVEVLTWIARNRADPPSRPAAPKKAAPRKAAPKKAAPKKVAQRKNGVNITVING